MKHILLFGAGKSSTALIHYLLRQASVCNWHLTVVDSNLQAVEEKLGGSLHATAKSFDVTQSGSRLQAIAAADLVISLLPPALHFLVATDCLATKKNLLTASYIDAQTESLATDVKTAGLLFLYEMGLDPGIDHMSAMRLIDAIRDEGAAITHFHSHCGGLVAPESDDNPWHYKISWNPANVVAAGKAGAVYRLNGSKQAESYLTLWDHRRRVFVPGAGTLSWYPNRDSLRYIPIYGLENTTTFLRTTLRHPQFMQGWKNVVKMGLTDEQKIIHSDGLSLKNFFSNWPPADAHSSAQTETESNAENWRQQQEAMGWNDNETLINKGLCSAADVLQLCVEKNLAMQANDKDRVVMLHEIVYIKQGEKYKVNSHLVLDGDDAKHTAMAKTVGLPLGITARLILEGKLELTGLHTPVLKEIYTPVLQELEEHGIAFTDNTIALP